MKRRVTSYGIGGYDTGKPANNVTSDTTLDVPGLGVDVQTIPADGVTQATFDYFTTDPTITTATWTVNGAVQAAVALTNGGSTLKVTAAAAGPVIVSCNTDPAVTIQAV